MSMKISPLSWIVASVLCSSLAHVLLKLGANRLELQGGVIEVAIRVGTNGWLVGGMLLQVMALGLWVLGLQLVQLSITYPVIAIGFVLVSILSWMFLGDSFTTWRLTGMLLIVSGVCVVARY